MAKFDVMVRGNSENPRCIHEWAKWFDMPVDPNGWCGDCFRGWYGDWLVIGSAGEVGWNLIIRCSFRDEPAARKLVTDLVTRLIPEVVVVTKPCHSAQR